MKEQGYQPKNLVSKLIFGILLGIVVIAVFLMFTDFKKIVSELQEMPGSYLLLAFVLTFCSYLLRLWKWHAFTKWSDIKISLKDNTSIFFIGLMMSITPGKAGELIKGYFLQKRAGTPYAKSLPIVFFDRLTDIIAMALLVGLGLIVYPFGILPFSILIIGVVLFLIMLPRKKWMEQIIDWVTKPERLTKYRENLHSMYAHSLSFVHTKILGFSLIVSFAAWFLECLSLYVILQAFELPVSLLASILTFSLGTVAGAVSMIPGGLGAAEGSITGLLLYFGVGSSLAVSISLLIRFVTLWFGVLLGILVFIKTRKKFQL
ncbi:lysylphosphatidylglycerol synthase transmembrane domain-containing protein [Radiobacillus deserti]|uniref:Phosphatidylglycerol lysyltransferase n=1 Tax=Radiobacillus deserti TaxID=2594883 RepID=A0A516KJQ2_9BACI|nr:lysylphosphatidylglycerol synthase transmembrane domain-containing protein [Radiobacillus deserti]QDP41599.1 flippase-like domain-containing protein [Radiobacillus deserti]